MTEETTHVIDRRRLAGCARYVMAGVIAGVLRLAALEPGEVIPVPEGGFEQGGRTWSIPADGVATVVEDPDADGRYCLRVEDPVKNGGSDVTSTRIPLPNGGLYVLRGMVRPERGNGLGMYVRRFDENGDMISGESHVIGLGGDSHAWEPFEQEFIVSERSRTCEIWIHSYQAAIVTASVDKLELVFKDGPDMVTKADMDTVKQRLRERVKGTPPNVEKITEVLEKQRDDGSWRGIDYEDDGRASWGPSGHMGRLLILARGHAAGDVPDALRQRVAVAMGKGLDFWFERDFTCPNWWYNQIGVPRQLYRAMLLTEEILTPGQLASGLRILRRARLGMTGQNLVWVAEVTIARGCLAQDAMVVWEAFRRMEGEVRMTTTEGIQPDWSFYQHGPQLYSGGYGRGFSQDVPYFASLAHGTQFAFADSKIEILAHYLLDGQQWMTRGQRFDYSACGREISRRGAANARGLASACHHMMTVDPERSAEYEAFAGRLKNGIGPEIPAFTGHKHFWRSDFTVHHRPQWYASARITSPRVLQTETCNRENVIGAHLSDGVMYLLTDGNDYDGIFPVWDWKRLPGITVALNAEEPLTRGGARGTHAFSGGVSDGTFGCTAMIFERDSLRARKAWFFHDRAAICLGAGISSKDDVEVITSVNQCLLKGPVTVSAAGDRRVLSAGEHSLDGVDWVHHHGFGYMPLADRRAMVKNTPQVGSWHRVNRNYPDTEVSLDVFSMWLDHGRQPDDAGYAYAVMHASTPDAAQAFAEAPGLDVLSNTPSLQAVLNERNGMVQAVFYEGGSLTLGAERPPVSVDRACMLMTIPTETGVRLSVCDPSGKAEAVNVSLGGKLASVSGGPTAAHSVDGHTRITVALPTDEEYAGSTVTHELIRRQ